MGLGWPLRRDGCFVCSSPALPSIGPILRRRALHSQWMAAGTNLPVSPRPMSSRQSLHCSIPHPLMHGLGFRVYRDRGLGRMARRILTPSGPAAIQLQISFALWHPNRIAAAGSAQPAAALRPSTSALSSESVVLDLRGLDSAFLVALFIFPARLLAASASTCLRRSITEWAPSVGGQLFRCARVS